MDKVWRPTWNKRKKKKKQMNLAALQEDNITHLRGGGRINVNNLGK